MGKNITFIPSRVNGLPPLPRAKNAGRTPAAVISPTAVRETAHLKRRAKTRTANTSATAASPSSTHTHRQPRRTPHALSNEVLRYLATVPAEHMNDISTSIRFFKGIRYIFKDNVLPALGYRNGEECEGVALVLHKDEPPAPPHLPYRALKFTPEAIIVRPLAVDISDFHTPGLPPGCIAVRPQKNVREKVRLTPAMKVGDVVTNEVHVQLFGYKLCSANVVSDHWAQGQNFRNRCWIADMLPASTGHVAPSSFLVMTTRFPDEQHFQTLRRLWKEGDLEGEQLVKAKIKSATTMSEDLRAEYARLRILAWETQVKFQPLFERHGCALPIGDRPPPYTPRPPATAVHKRQRRS